MSGALQEHETCRTIRAAVIHSDRCRHLRRTYDISIDVLVQAPDSRLGEPLAQGKLVEVLPGYRAAPTPVTLLYPNRHQLAERARLFMR